jgi:RNA polymerase sigma factor (sigma-70 family)
MSCVPGGPLEDKTDAELVELARERDKAAFCVLAQRYESAARRFAARLSGGRDWAPEVLQESLLEAYLSLEHLRDPAKFAAWLNGIVLNVHRRFARQQRPASVPLEAIGESPDLGRMTPWITPESPQHGAERHEMHLAVVEALKTLAPALQKAVFLFYFDGLSIPEIASAIGVSQAAVKVRLHRARHQLKEILKADHPEMVPRRGRKQMISVTIADIRKFKPSEPFAPGSPIAPGAFWHVILLKDESSRKVLPIWVGQFEGESIATGMERFSTARPMTYDFMASLLKALGAHVEEVRVETLKDETFYAVVKVRAGRTIREIDARPSDAIAVAVRMGSPIFVADDVMNKAGLAVPEGKEPAGGNSGIRNIINDLGEQMRQNKSRPAFTQERVAKMVDEFKSAIFKT